MTRAIAPIALSLALAAPAASAEPTYRGHEGTRVLTTPDVGVVVRPMPEDPPLRVWIAGRAVGNGRAALTVRFIAMEAGTFDLRDALFAADGSPVAIDDANARVEVVALVPAAQSGSVLAGIDSPRPTISQRWRDGLVLATTAWLIGVAWIGVRSRRNTAPQAAKPAPPTVPDEAAAYDALLARLAIVGLDADERRAFERLARRSGGQSFGDVATGPMGTIEQWQYQDAAVDDRALLDAAERLRPASAVKGDA